MGEAAGTGAETLVAQNAAEKEERVQEISASALGSGQPDQRTRHREGARQVPATPHQDVRVEQLREKVVQRDRDEGIYLTVNVE